MKASRENYIEPVAMLYAKALFEVAVESKQVDSIQAELIELAALLSENAALNQAVASSIFSPEEREKLVVALSEQSQMSPVMTKFFKLLTAKNRVVVIDSIRDAFQLLSDQKKGIMRGTVSTVEALSSAEAAELAKAFTKKLGKQVVLESVTDKEILGGLVVNVQGRTFDGSLKTTIRRLKDTLERQSI